MSPLLSFRTVGAPSATKVGWILHGLLGNGRNWNSFAINLINYLGSDYKFYLLDLRHHGLSSRNSSFIPPDTIDNCVNDLLMLSQETNIWPTTMIGHSFGGKVLMRLVQRQDDIEKYVPTSSSSIPPNIGAGNSANTNIVSSNVNVFVLDSMPGISQDHLRPETTVSSTVPLSLSTLNQQQQSSSYTTTSNFVDRHPKDVMSKVLQLIQKMPTPLPSRKIIRDTFLNAGMPDKLATWMASNVSMESHGTNNPSHVPSSTTFRWAFNPEGASNLYNSHMETDTWSILTEGPKNPHIHIHLLKASRSHRWNEPDSIEKLQFIEKQNLSNVHIHNVAGGHWLHVDNPKGVMEIISHGLNVSSKHKLQ